MEEVRDILNDAKLNLDLSLMVLDWKPLSAVFCSFLDGSFVEKIGTFSDEQLLPFMPYLISTSFIPESDNCISYLFLWVSYILDFLDPSEDSSLTTSFVTDDVFEEIGCILSLAVLHMPSIFNIEKLVMKLLSTNHGTDLLTLVIANMCELFHPVLSILLNIHVSDETPIGRQRSNLISNLIDLAPSIASSILSQMTSSRRDCMLAARIACSRLDDAAFCEFLVSQLVDKSTILAQNLNRSSSKHTMTLISNRLMKLADISVKNQSTEPLTDLMSSIVSLYLNCGLKLPPSDLSLLSAFICRKNIEDESHLVLALAALIAIPPFTFHNAITAPVPHTVDVHIVEWLSWLRMETNGCSRPVLSHALLFLGISLVNSRIDNLNLYLTEVLKCNKVRTR
uniref:MMS19 nucleotide excision repair protein n=1 Tax=Heterorhabditis bacteriophora TaxID=37862 RepID=A0A1I7X477_HETBA